MIQRVSCLLALFFTMAFGQVGANAADGLREAKAHAERALRLYNLGNFEEAISEFSKAYEIDPSPVLLFNIAHTHRAAGNLDRALFFYRRYLIEAPPNAPNREKAKQFIHELEEKIATQKAAKAKPPVAAPISAAPVAPTASATTPSPSPTAGPARDSPSNAPLVLAAPPPRPATAEPQGSTPGTSTPDGHTSTKRTLAWIAGGAAVVSLVTGAVFQLGGYGKFSDFDRSCGLVRGTNKPVDDPTKPGGTDAGCAALYNSWHSDNDWAVIGYAAGAAFAVTSAVLFYTSRSESTSGIRAHLDCSPGPGTVLVCGGVF